RIFTAGAVFEPRWLKNFSATLDYFAVRLDQAIGDASVTYILSECYPAAAGVAPKNCDLIQRDPVTHTIVNVTAVLTNIGVIRSDGIDLALRYALPTSFGRFQFVLDGVWLHKIDVTQSDGTVVHGRG